MARIAIVGTGISGLGAAFLLNQRHDVTVFEIADRIGGHSCTAELNYDDVQIAVDIGFIVFNHQNYPHLSAMFRHLNVPVHASNMTFAASIADGAFEWGAENLNTIVGQRRNLFRPMFYRLLHDVTQFNRHALNAVNANPHWTLDELIDALQLGEEFCRYYILPMTAAIWSCPPSQMRKFPARTLVQFFANHNLLSISGQPQWFTVTGGSKSYVKRLAAGFANRIRTNAKITSVSRDAGCIAVSLADGTHGVFDHIVFACHADEILPMLTDATDREREVLSAFRFQPNKVVLHRDPSVMPLRKRCWAAWNYRSDGSSEEPAISVSYWMNRLQGIRMDRPVFVTLNPSTPIPDERVFLRQQFSHPVFDHRAIAAQSEIQGLQGQKHTWFCGAWLRHGFHEDGLQSAVSVAERLGVSVPWRNEMSVPESQWAPEAGGSLLPIRTASALAAE